MKENLLYFAKLTSSSLFSFLKINILGAVSTVSVFIIGLFLLAETVNVGSSGHVSAIPFVMMSVFTKPLTATLFYLICIASPFLFFMLCNKYLISKNINKLIKDKSDNYVNPVLDKILGKIKDRKNIIVADGKNYDSIKSMLMNQLKNENENKIVSKVITYGLKKVNLDDVDFKSDNFSIIETIKTKVIQALKNVSEPSRKPIFIVIAVQWIILILLWLLPI